MLNIHLIIFQQNSGDDKMSVELFRFDRDQKDKSARVVLCRAIAGESFYQKCWHNAIVDTGVKLFRDNSSFSPDQVDSVIKELIQLDEWCKKNLCGNNYSKMHDTIVEFLNLLPEEAPKSNEPFYIF